MAYFAAPNQFLMAWMQYILPLVISGFTGWFVIWISFKLLFRPHKPVFIAGFKIQGIIPANQQLMAEKIGRLVSKEMFSFDTLQEKVVDPENFNKLKPEIETHIENFLRVRLKETFPMLSILIGDKTINQLKGAFLLELETLFPVLMKSYLATLEKELDIEKMITQRIDFSKLFQEKLGDQSRSLGVSQRRKERRSSSPQLGSWTLDLGRLFVK